MFLWFSAPLSWILLLIFSQVFFEPPDASAAGVVEIVKGEALRDLDKGLEAFFKIHVLVRMLSFVCNGLRMLNSEVVCMQFFNMVAVVCRF